MEGSCVGEGVAGVCTGRGDIWLIGWRGQEPIQLRRYQEEEEACQKAKRTKRKVCS